MAIDVKKMGLGWGLPSHAECLNKGLFTEEGLIYVSFDDHPYIWDGKINGDRKIAITEITKDGYGSVINTTLDSIRQINEIDVQTLLDNLLIVKFNKMSAPKFKIIGNI